MIDEIKSVLRECEVLKNINVLDDKKFKKFSYEQIIKANLIINSKKKLAITICIPKMWYENLIDIYVDNYEDLPFIPHISRNGKICLFDVEGCLIDKNLGGIIVQSLFRAKDILEKGFSGENSDDFIEEFELYLSELQNVRQAKFVVPESKQDMMIKCQYKIIKQNKKEKYAQYVKRVNESVYYLGEGSKELERWEQERTCIKNAAYFLVYPTSTIYPPDTRKHISLDYINSLLEYTSSETTKMLLKLSNEKIILFAVNQPNGVCNYVGFLVTGGVIKKIEHKYYFKSCETIQPIVIRRADKEYMLMRTKEKGIVKKKKILVIGCGSIGGHLINELVKAGYEDLTIVDDDVLTEENIFRHVLGMEYVALPKCDALANYIKRNIPDVLIKPLKEKADEAILEEDLELDDYDMVVSAVGNHNFNRWLNEYVISKQLKVPIIYAWNEVCGIGNHVAYFKVGNKSCYECLFERDEYTGEIYDKTAYCGRGQKIVHNSGGCGKSYVPYGNTISIKTVLICLDVIRDIFENNVDDNMLISMKGDKSYFTSKGLETSTRYLNQKEQVKKLFGKEFANCKCGVCNGDRK